MALAISVWLTAGTVAACSRRAVGATAAVDEAFGLMEKACLRGLDSMWPLRVNVTARRQGRHAQGAQNIGVNRPASVDGGIAQHVRFFV
jgi:hypothetical protein